MRQSRYYKKATRRLAEVTKSIDITRLCELWVPLYLLHLKWKSCTTQNFTIAVKLTISCIRSKRLNDFGPNRFCCKDLVKIGGAFRTRAKKVFLVAHYHLAVSYILFYVEIHGQMFCLIYVCWHRRPDGFFVKKIVLNMWPK